MITRLWLQHWWGWRAEGWCTLWGIEFSGLKISEDDKSATPMVEGGFLPSWWVSPSRLDSTVVWTDCCLERRIVFLNKTPVVKASTSVWVRWMPTVMWLLRNWNHVSAQAFDWVVGETSVRRLRINNLWWRRRLMLKPSDSGLKRPWRTLQIQTRSRSQISRSLTSAWVRLVFPSPFESNNGLTGESNLQTEW